MSKTETKIDLSALSAEDLKKELARRESEDKEKRRRAREHYENEKDSLVKDLMAEAKVLEAQMKDFKTRALTRLNAFKELAQEYGGIRSNSKGGFSLRHSESQEMVSLDRNTFPEYDERASLAEGLLKEFLEDTIKKHDKRTYRTVSALIEKNKKGDYRPAQIADLLKIKDNYDDARWIKALQLFEESFQVRDISYSVSFYRKNTLQKDQALCLTFASIPVDETEEKAAEK
jgi:hypothetical protein